MSHRVARWLYLSCRRADAARVELVVAYCRGDNAGSAGVAYCRGLAFGGRLASGGRLITKTFHLQ